MPTIKYADRIFVTGATRSGKSRLVRELVLSAAPPRVVIDPVGSAITKLPDIVTFRDPAHMPRASNIRFVPTDPADLDAYDEVYAEIQRRIRAREWRNVMVWCDEAGDVLPASGAPRRANALVVQGAKQAIGHIALHTRPREVLRGLIANAAHVAIFVIPAQEDRKYLAGCVGVPLAVLEELLEDLSEGEFLWWEQATRTLTPCARLRLPTLAV